MRPSDRPLLPAALIDSTRRRALAALRRLGDGAGLLPRLLAATGHELAWAVVPLGRGDLYARETAERARAVARELLGSAPAWVTLERGRRGGLHLNVVCGAGAAASWPAGTCCQAVTDAEGLVRYLSKPADARACKVKHPITGRWSRPSVADQVAALEDYRRARERAGGRLPRLSWTNCLPFLRPDVAASGSLIASDSPAPEAHPPKGDENEPPRRHKADVDDRRGGPRAARERESGELLAQGRPARLLPSRAERLADDRGGRARPLQRAPRLAPGLGTCTLSPSLTSPGSPGPPAAVHGTLPP